MSKPAARIGDNHVCPMVTPGTPPIPHVGGPITGPGVPTVLIGGVPAAVMGDMCVCTGPPDTITLGSTGVLIGGKPAARMGDMCAHGGTIVVGCPTVLIGEVSPDGMSKANPVVNSIMAKIEGFEGGKAGGLAARQAMSLNQAAIDGMPFCEVCEAASEDSENSQEDSEGDVEKNPRVTNLVWMKGDDIVDSSLAGKGVTIRAQVVDIEDGEEVTFTISDPSMVGDGHEPIELKGKVKDGYVEMDWEVEDPYSDEEGEEA